MKPFRLWIYRLIAQCLPETRFFQFKVHMLRWCGAVIGENVRVTSSAMFVGDGNLIIGDDVWIGAQSFICPVCGTIIEIGSCVDIAPQVMFITGSHEIDIKGSHIAGTGYSTAIKIGDGCWLGARSTILPGVVLSRKTIIASGSVVCDSCNEENSLMAGVPAIIKKIYRNEQF